MLSKHAPGKCFRYGGEEFVVIGAHADIKNFSLQLDQMRIRMHEAPFALRATDRPRGNAAPAQQKRGQGKQPHTTHISISIGVAEPRDEEDNTKAVIARADKALYKAKSSGRNCLRTAR